MSTELIRVNMPTGIPENCQVSTSNEVLVGTGLIRGSHATLVPAVPSSTGRRASWAFTMAVGRISMRLAQSLPL
jgi:hypothetical protein